MSDRSELLEAALEMNPEGIALIDLEGRVVFWNRSAETFTGYAAANIVGRAIPAELEPIISCPSTENSPVVHHGTTRQQGTLVHAQHASGHDLPALTRTLTLRNSLGEHIGKVAHFHPALHNAALPHGESSDAPSVTESQSELTDRLECDFQSFKDEGQPLVILWIGVDQAHGLRQTHGERAAEAMLASIERTLANAMRPGEEVGRWGDDEFLVVCPLGDRDPLACRAQVLAGLARTSVFRWWGDRISLTVSIGAAEARSGEALPQLLDRAQEAMLMSIRKGGNCVSVAPGGQPCLQS